MPVVLDVLFLHSPQGVQEALLGLQIVDAHADLAEDILTDVVLVVGLVEALVVRDVVVTVIVAGDGVPLSVLGGIPVPAMLLFNQMYREGLLTDDSFTVDKSQLEQEIAAGRVFASMLMPISLRMSSRT